MKSIYESLQMEGVPAEQQAVQAIKHVLTKMKTDDRIYHLIGMGSQSFDLLTEAYSTLTGEDLPTLRKSIAGA